MTDPHLFWIVFAAVLGAGILVGCSDEPAAPAHYYVMCEGEDGNGWSLIDTRYQAGYLVSCTYQSPDKAQSITLNCGEEDCD